MNEEKQNCLIDKTKYYSQQDMCAEPNYEAIISEYEKQIIETETEINRLNNIINELEKWLIDYQEGTGLSTYESGLRDALGDVLNKLKELKEGNK